MKKQVTILTGEPTIELIAEQKLNWEGVRGMARWVKGHRPECLPDGFDPELNDGSIELFPHERLRVVDPSVPLNMSPNSDPSNQLTDNELLVELAGRKCYDSFGLKAGRKSNADYIAHTQMLTDPAKEAESYVYHTTGASDEAKRHHFAASLQAERDRVPHASILYHAKLTFFIGGLSRRVSHELIRNYVGADRTEEGAPSQESTRFTHHYGYYVAPPRIVDNRPHDGELTAFQVAMQSNYESYLEFIERQFFEHGGDPKGMDRKRIYEAASAYLSHACETSLIWTTNPGALMKLWKERCGEAADLEFQRFAKKWRRVSVAHAPNLFPGVRV